MINPIFSGYDPAKDLEKIDDPIKRLEFYFRSQPQDDTAFFGKLLDPKRLEEIMRSQAKIKLEFDKEQLKEAYPYQLSRQIPEQISQGFGNAQAIRLLGAQLGQQAAMQGVDAIAQGRFVPYGPLTEFKYFNN
jgi:hypothetical protein